MTTRKKLNFSHMKVELFSYAFLTGQIYRQYLKLR